MERNKKRIKVYLYILAVVFIAIVGYLFAFYMSVIDTNNVKIEGYVLEKKSKKPIEKVVVTINNYRYESNTGYKNYDEYLGHDKIIIYTDKNGYYSTIIKKSAFIVMNFEKKGFKKHLEDGKYSKKHINCKVYLDK